MRRVELILSEPHLAWVHLDDGEVVVRGDADTLPERDTERVRVFVPAVDDVILSPVDLAELPPAQARAAARLAIGDESLIPSGDLHVVCSEDGLTAASVSRMAVAQWIADCDPDIILPAALLLPRTDEGVCTAHLGALKLVRSPLFAGGWDDVITPLMIGDQPIQALTAAEFDAAMAAAATGPEMNLRQGEFERRTRLTLDGALVRKTCWLVGALIVITLLIPLIAMIRLNTQSDTLEATARTAAQTAVGANVPEDQALAALDARLAALRGGGAGFANTSAAVNLAVQATPNVELTMITFTPDGVFRASVRATKPEEIDAVAARMRALGLEVESGSLNPAQGQPIVELKVRGR